ncbi:MAG: hypothetical protein JWO00_611, partial [Candidatus Parcubacteria bacterium]|nr:hypothetical protein [Candidatus Parcubacteria bacterium]
MNSHTLPPAIRSGIISRDKIVRLTTACMIALQKRGFPPISLDYKDSSFGAYEELVEDACISLFGEIESRPKIGVARKACNIDHKTLDRATLECAYAFAREVPSEIHHNETLNEIRMILVKMLHRMGYENLRHLCLSIKPGWGCYPEWEAVASADGMSDVDIKDTREWFQRHHPEHYEESTSSTS